MTAEIAILNKSAVALAADSAVTIGGPSPKIFNTVNKLFTLSKFHPVGVMIYGNAQFLGVPWEIIFKAYRQNLGSRSFPHLGDYLTDFISFIEGHEGLFSKDVRYGSMEFIVATLVRTVKGEFDKRVKSRIDKYGGIDLAGIHETIAGVLSESAKRIVKEPRHPSFDEAFEGALRPKVSIAVGEAARDVFEKLPVSEYLEPLTDVATKYLIHGALVGKAGVVVAGYGDDDYFPRLESIETDSIVEGKLRYVKAERSDISGESRGEIIPFAQTNVVHGFLTGIDPLMEDTVRKLNRRIFENLPDTLSKALGGNAPGQNVDLVANLKAAAAEMTKVIEVELQTFKQERFIAPIMETVAFLPKDELAAMAETLVSLTSFKRKFSLDAETVGGPIDVAVISKGDGFIWIKRKHYFKAELNPNFLTNYLRKQ